MDPMSRDELKTLMEKHDGACVSIFMPAHRGGKDIPQDKIRFKNLLKDAEERLVATGVRSTEAKELLAPAEGLLNMDSLFWVYQSDGLAVFLSRDFSRYYRLPLEPEESVSVTDRFHIRPLLPLFTGDGQFYLLALSQKQIRLFQGTRYGLCQIKLASLPESMAEALAYVDREKQLQFHTGTRERKGSERAAMFFTHGVGGEIRKDDIYQYFLLINSTMHEFLTDKRDPLLLAGVEYLFPTYREANTYPHLLDKGVAGNPEDISPEELHRRAWAIMEPYFAKEQEDAVARYGDSAGTGLASNDLREIVPSARYGRVDSLFIAAGAEQRGAFDPDNNTVALRQEAEPGDEDLLDLAAVQTILHGGTVYPMEPEKVPGAAPAAAVFRY